MTSSITRALEEAEEIAPAEGSPPEQELADPCPVIVLGSRDGTYHYLTPRGEYRTLRYDRHNDAGLVSLFGGSTAWLQRRFPRVDQNQAVVGYVLPAGRNYLFRTADSLPLFDATRVLRGPGLWLDEQEGVIVHAGDEVSLHGAWRPAGTRIGRHVYPLGPALPKPAERPARSDDWFRLWKVLGSWNWHQPQRDRLLRVGWLATASIAGLSSWNPAIWTTGSSGSGKSKLQKLDRVVLGEPWIVAVSEPTEAGVRQSLGPSARPVLVDEIEPSDVGTRARDVARLVRVATDPEQAAVVRGSANGEATSFPIRAVLAFSSILIPPLETQDRNRLTVFELGELEANDRARVRLDRLIRHFERRSPHLRARMLQRYPAIARVKACFEAELVKAKHKSRLIDQASTLLAGAWVAMYDGDKPPDHLVKNWVLHFPAPAAVDLQEDSDAWQCLGHLLSSSPEKRWEGDRYRRVTVGEMVAGAREMSAVTTHLAGYGLGLWEHPETKERCLVVANNHEGLEEIFRATRWSGGVWAQALSRLEPGMKAKADKLLSFRSRKQRGTWVPLRLIPDGRDALPVEDPPQPSTDVPPRENTDR